MSIIVLFVVFLVSVSAHTGKVIDAAEGFTAPFFTLEQGNSAVSLADYKGKYVLLTFWASNDASSRMACREYAGIVNELNGGNICHLSINFDRSKRLFDELVRNDGLDAETQFYAQGDAASRIMKDYHLEDGFRSYLVDPQGQIVAMNPNRMRLTQILNH